MTGCPLGASTGGSIAGTAGTLVRRVPPWKSGAGPAAMNEDRGST